MVGRVVLKCFFYRRWLAHFGAYPRLSNFRESFLNRSPTINLSLRAFLCLRTIREIPCVSGQKHHRIIFQCPEPPDSEGYGYGCLVVHRKNGK